MIENNVRNIIEILILLMINPINKNNKNDTNHNNDRQQSTILTMESKLMSCFKISFLLRRFLFACFEIFFC